MSNLKIYAQPGKVMHIGRVGENLATEVVFDISHWFEEYGTGTVNLLVEQNGLLYIPEKIENTNSSEVRWTITNENTAVAGLGRCELYYSNNKFIVKSDIYDFIVTATLDEDEIGVPPVPFKSWFDEVISAANEIQEKYDSAEEVLEAVQEAREAAENAQTAAAASAQIANEEAEKAVGGAETATTKAGEAADSANLSKQWAEGTFTDGSKSAKEWSIEAGNTVSEGIENIEQLKTDTQNIYDATVLIKGEAESAKTDAIKAKDDAEAARDVATSSAGVAATSATNASESAQIASTQAERSEQYGTKPAIPVDGYWHIWRIDDNGNGSYVQEPNARSFLPITGSYQTKAEMEAAYLNHSLYELVIVSAYNDFDENGNPVPAKLYMRVESLSSPWEWIMDLKGYEGVGISGIQGPNTPGVDGAIDTHVISMTDLSEYELKIRNGVDGNSITSVQKIAGTGAPGTLDTYEIQFTKKVPFTYEVYNGKDGYTPQKGIDYVDGIDGFSPTIQVEDIANGHRVIITDKDGTQSFEVLDGKDGEGSGDMLAEDYDPDGTVLAAGGIKNYVDQKIQLKTWTAADLNI